METSGFSFAVPDSRREELLSHGTRNASNKMGDREDDAISTRISTLFCSDRSQTSYTNSEIQTASENVPRIQAMRIRYKSPQEVSQATIWEAWESIISPGISKAIEEMVKKSVDTLMPHPVPSRTWQKLGSDMFQYAITNIF